MAAKQYIISVDQSTQGTKVLLFDENAKMIARVDKLHKQIVNELGWVSHNPEEIYQNVVYLIKQIVEKYDIKSQDIAGISISNQRETCVMWDRVTGEVMDLAVVWQCNRAEAICQRKEISDKALWIRERTGLPLSPYFPAAKIAWLSENVKGAKEKAGKHEICHGTIDSWLVFRLTGGRSYKTDYSNASRTQLFDLIDLKWNKQICELFGIDVENLPEIVDSDARFGETTLEGYFENPIPIHAVMGDSHAALFGQGCHERGMIKTTYGTGSSIMMNIGEKPVTSKHGVVTSLAWAKSGKVQYVLEGNLNYTGAVITWLKDKMCIISSPSETTQIANHAMKNDSVYVVPAFSGLGAPYWDSKARAAIVGMDRTTGREEIVRAALECIAYQIMDVIHAMEEDSEILVRELRVDGGPTRNPYLMQFQSDILDAIVQIPKSEELSGMGAAYMAGLSLGIWNTEIFSQIEYTPYYCTMEQRMRMTKIEGWKNAVRSTLIRG